MNNLKKITLAFVIFISVVSCKKTEEPKKTELEKNKKTEIAAANAKTTSFEIEGMTCAVGCAATIEKKLSKLEGVGEAKVDFETKTATVTYDITKQSQESLTKIVENVGGGDLYKVGKIKS